MRSSHFAFTCGPRCGFYQKIRGLSFISFGLGQCSLRQAPNLELRRSFAASSAALAASSPPPVDKLNTVPPGWAVVIGIEVHAQLQCATKLFSSSSNIPSNSSSSPNNPDFVSYHDLALPGTLPALNNTAVVQAIQTGLALHGRVQRYSCFQRKHYFYCDMPQGYQITQQAHPIVMGGHVVIDADQLDSSCAPKSAPCDGNPYVSSFKIDQSSSGAGAAYNGPDSERYWWTGGKRVKRIGLARIQLEQDSGKSVHDVVPSHSCIDFNRCGTPLLEIVSHPHMSSSLEAVSYVRTLTKILQCISVCRGFMEDGSLRCDVNVSVHRTFSTPSGSLAPFPLSADSSPALAPVLGERVEIKNLNSLRSLKLAIDFEVHRQVALLAGGGVVERQTRTFDSRMGKTVLLRSKEDMLDYRFAWDGDLPPLVLDAGAVDRVAAAMPLLPEHITAILQSYELQPRDVHAILQQPGAFAFFQRVVYNLHDDHAIMLHNRAFVARRFTNSSSVPAPAPASESQSALLLPARDAHLCASWFTSNLFGLLHRAARHPSRESAGADGAVGTAPDVQVDFDDTSLSLEDSLSATSNARRVPLLHHCRVLPAQFGSLIDVVGAALISSKVAKDVLQIMVDGDVRLAQDIISERGWAQLSDPHLIDSIIDQVWKTEDARIRAYVYKFASSSLRSAANIRLTHSHSDSRAPTHNSNKTLNKRQLRSGPSSQPNAPASDVDDLGAGKGSAAESGSGNGIARSADRDREHERIVRPLMGACLALNKQLNPQVLSESILRRLSRQLAANRDGS